MKSKPVVNHDLNSSNGRDTNGNLKRWLVVGVGGMDLEMHCLALGNGHIGVFWSSA
jgi:hypothetical protein